VKKNINNNKDVIKEELEFVSGKIENLI